jgi:hypothetical protein
MGAPVMFHHLRSIPRNAALLVGLLMLIVLAPVLPPEHSWFILELMFGLILISGVHSVGGLRRRSIFAALTVVTLGVRWGQQLSDLRGIDITALGLTAVWLFVAVAIIIKHLFQYKEVEVDTILGAIVTYLLAAVGFALVFEILELAAPGAFAGLPDEGIRHQRELSSTMMYHSLVSITTMGYGDIVPVAPLARSLSVIEGVFGQLYLAVMIARLVGLHISRDTTTT